MSKPSRVEILGYNDVKKAALTLYTAFDDDDVARYATRHLEHDPVKKKKIDLQVYESYLVSHMMKGLVLGIKGDDHENKDTYETVSIWVRPDSGSLDDYLTLIRSGFAKLAWDTGSEGRRRIFSVMFKILHDNYEKIISIDPNHENTWTLVYLGSTPDARGKGNVREMLDYIFDNYIDPANSLTYLESSAIRNLPIYERFGFRAVADIWLGDIEHPVDKARMDVMVRGPKGKQWEYLEEARKMMNYEIPEASIHK